MDESTIEHQWKPLVGPLFFTSNGASKCLKEPNPFHDDLEIGPNMHAVNLDVIKPRTALAGGMSWALMLNQKGLEGDFFFAGSPRKAGPELFATLFRELFHATSWRVYIIYIYIPGSSRSFFFSGRGF